MGLAALSFNEQEQQLLGEFITVSTPFFDKVRQNRPDKPSHDLVLGLLTKSQQEALAEYQATKPKIDELKQMFSDKVGAEHAGKFITLNQAEVTVIASLWFMAQGYTGIDFSYANDHAQEIAELLGEHSQFVEKHKQFASAGYDSERYRTRFMQAYYTGIDHAEKKQTHGNTYMTIKSYIKRLFGL